MKIYMNQHAEGTSRDIARSPFDMVLEEAITVALEKEIVTNVVDYLREDPGAKIATIQEIIERCGNNTTKAARLNVEIIELLSHE